MIRYPAVAGTFYPSDPIELRKIVLSLLAKVPEYPERDYVGAIVPHAGYVYSGPIAAHAYKALSKVEGKPVVIVGPNHTGEGLPVSIFPEGEWVTPIGSVPVDAELAAEIRERSEIAEFDPTAHIFEHSIEVQLPFLQSIYPAFSFVPITMLDQSYDAAKDLAKAIPDNVLFIASSDFSHYVPADVGKSLDMPIVESILHLDARGILEGVEKGASPCGYGPMMALVEWAKRVGAKAELLAFGSSGDVTGDYSSVVDYAAIVFYR